MISVVCCRLIPTRAQKFVSRLCKFLGMMTKRRLEQSLNINLPIVFMPSGIVIQIRLVQPSNARHAIEVTLLGILIEARLVQPLNVLHSILVIP